MEKISQREKEIMMIFWKEERALIASELCKLAPQLSINTINVVIKRLLNKNYLKIDSIVYSGTVLTRKFIPQITANEYLTNMLKAHKKNLNLSLTALFSALIDDEKNEAETIIELEKFILAKKRLLEEKEGGK